MTGLGSDRDERIAAALRPYLFPNQPHGEGVLLAVSGGPDSTALMHAAACAGARVSVATVDHGLRPSSADEARAVGALARRHGLDHSILTWTGPRRATGVQAAARVERYRLLAAHASEMGATSILTGHTADDQAETVLMRLLAGSGPAGLSAMRPTRAIGEGVRLARPFLAIRKADLVSYCEAHGLAFVRDPSNADTRFARARLRDLLPRLAAEGLSADRLCKLAERATRDDDALATWTARMSMEVQRPSEPGTIALDGRRLVEMPSAIAIRIVDAALDTLQSSQDPPGPRRLERSERLVLEALLPALAAGTTLRRTLRGSVVEATAAGEVRIRAAPPRTGPRARADEPGCAPVAGDPDLLGKGEGAAYIGRERVE